MDTIPPTVELYLVQVGIGFRLNVLVRLKPNCHPPAAETAAAADRAGAPRLRGLRGEDGQTGLLLGVDDLNSKCEGDAAVSRC